MNVSIVLLLFASIHVSLATGHYFIKKNDGLSDDYGHLIKRAHFQAIDGVFYNRELNKVIQERRKDKIAKEKKQQQKIERENLVFRTHLINRLKGSSSIFRDFHTTRY